LIQKICIYGVGAIGGWIGARLAASGLEVSAVARGATLEALQHAGLALTENAEQNFYSLRARSEPAELGAQDLVVLAVKAPALREVAQHIAPLLAPHTIVLSCLNGVPWWFLQGFGGALKGQTLHSVDAGGEIAQHIPAAQIVGCVVHASCSTRSHAHVQHHFGNKLIVGEPSGERSARVQALAELLIQAGFEAPISEQIQKDVWYKLWGNMTMNPVSALTGATTDKVLADDLLRGFIGAVMLEAKEIGARMGIPISQTPQDRHEVTRKLGAFKTSMLQDVENGRAVELDALVAAVRELGQKTGVPTPMTDALMGLARVQAQTLGLYPGE
jgi:2-dehydropantoate 2-reductase